MLKFRGIAAKIAIYVGLFIFATAAGLGLLAYYSGARAVVNEVERALEMQAITAGSTSRAALRSTHRTYGDRGSARNEIHGMGQAASHP